MPLLNRIMKAFLGRRFQYCGRTSPLWSHPHFTLRLRLPDSQWQRKTWSQAGGCCQRSSGTFLPNSIHPSHSIHIRLSPNGHVCTCCERKRSTRDLCLNMRSFNFVTANIQVHGVSLWCARIRCVWCALTRVVGLEYSIEEQTLSIRTPPRPRRSSRLFN